MEGEGRRKWNEGALDGRRVAIGAGGACKGRHIPQALLSRRYS